MIKALLHRAQRWVERLIFFTILAYLCTGNAPTPGAFDTQIERIMGVDRFDFAGWMIDALLEKGAVGSLPIQDYLDASQRAQFVVDYLDRTRRLFSIERDIDRIYADPNVTDPDAVSAARRAERDGLRAEIEQRRPTLEAIIQDQIATVLAEEGLSIGGRVFPPVLARITPLPHILILSPRDRIERVDSFDLSASLPVERIEVIENQVSAQLDKSAFVTPIGGLALYPAMIVETSDLLWLIEVIAHEWVHNWMFVRPLGMALLLGSGGDVWTINETVASLAGKEVGVLVLKRFYPDIAKRDYAYVYDPPKPAGKSDAPPLAPAPNVFNFNHAMRETRVQVDEYLATAHDLNIKAGEAEAAGRSDEARLLRADALTRIVKAETYMEEQRRLFLEKGYRIRKLNQAYFAFYGSYADEPGAAGADPVGPAVVELRSKIPSLSEFLNTVASVTTFDDLKRALVQYP